MMERRVPNSNFICKVCNQILSGKSGVDSVCINCTQKQKAPSLRSVSQIPTDSSSYAVILDTRIRLLTGFKDQKNEKQLQIEAEISQLKEILVKNRSPEITSHIRELEHELAQVMKAVKGIENQILVAVQEMQEIANVNKKASGKSVERIPPGKKSDKEREGAAERKIRYPVIKKPTQTKPTKSPGRFSSHY